MHTMNKMLTFKWWVQALSVGFVLVVEVIQTEVFWDQSHDNLGSLVVDLFEQSDIWHGDGLERWELHWDPDLEFQLAFTWVVVDQFVLVKLQVVIDNVESILPHNLDDGVSSCLDQVLCPLFNFKVFKSSLCLSTIKSEYIISYLRMILFDEFCSFV